MQLTRVMSGERVLWGVLEEGEVHVTAGMLGERTGEVLPAGGLTVLAPAEPTKIVCVGRNYVDHIKELNNLGAEGLPREPGLFLKGPNALENPGATVPYPDWTENLQYEGELALVIARRAKDLRPGEALDHVAGYTCALDLTARDRQREDLQWFRGKAADQFCPLGPTLVTDLDPRDVRLQTRLNGEVRQDGRTSLMIFDPVQILTYVTRFVTLEPGDVVLTGTPEGVGPLASGDQVEVEVEGVGTLLTHIG